MNDFTSACAAYWGRIFKFTEQMLRAAKEEAWEDLASIEKERRTVLYTSIPSLPDDSTRTAVRRVIQQVIEFDQEIITLCQDSQRMLAEKIQSLRIGERARKAYGL